jgi:hypothetical protein
MSWKTVNDAELEQIILSHLHTKPACKGAQRVKVFRSAENNSAANWNVSDIIEGAADKLACESELQRLVPQLQTQYRLQ